MKREDDPNLDSQVRLMDLRWRDHPLAPKCVLKLPPSQPQYEPRYDHMFSFYLLGNRVGLRNVPVCELEFVYVDLVEFH